MWTWLSRGDFPSVMSIPISLFEHGLATERQAEDRASPHFPKTYDFAPIVNTAVPGEVARVPRMAEKPLAQSARQSARRLLHAIRQPDPPGRFVGRRRCVAGSDVMCARGVMQTTPHR